MVIFLMNKTEKLLHIINSPVLWIETFCKINDKRGKTVRFKLNDEQKDFVRNKTAQDIILKSRQIGMSTLIDALTLYYVCTIPNIHCMLASYTQDSANAIYDKLKTIYYNLPESIRPAELQNNRKELALANGSKITVTTIGNRDIARGSSLFFCHLSEFAFVPDERANKQLLSIEQAMMPPIIRGKYCCGGIVIESTANGLNHYYELYNKAENHENTYTAHFYSWLNDYKMNEIQQKDYAKKYEIQNGKLIESQLTDIENTYLNGGATIEMLEWRRMKMSNNGKSFCQEYPAFPSEAFISTGNTVFDVSAVTLDYAQKQSINPLSDITGLPTLLSMYMNNYLTIWDKPLIGEKYYIGVDSAEGMGGTNDYSVISVFDSDGEQTAQFRSNVTKPFEIAEILDCIGRWYNTANIIVEAMSTGTIILDRLRNMYHYPNLYKYKDKVNGGKKKLGYPETPKTKAQLINDMIEWYTNKDINIKSLNTLSEMKTYLFDGVSTNAVRGGHDDCVISCALVIQAIKTHMNYLWF